MKETFADQNWTPDLPYLLVSDDGQHDEAVAEDGQEADGDVGAEDDVMQRSRYGTIVFVLPQDVPDFDWNSNKSSKLQYLLLKVKFKEPAI